MANHKQWVASGPPPSGARTPISYHELPEGSWQREVCREFSESGMKIAPFFHEPLAAPEEVGYDHTLGRLVLMPTNPRTELPEDIAA